MTLALSSQRQKVHFSFLNRVLQTEPQMRTGKRLQHSLAVAQMMLQLAKLIVVSFISAPKDVELSPHIGSKRSQHFLSASRVQFNDR